MTSEDRLLYIIYNLIKKARRINIKIQKLYNKEFKTNKL